MSESVNHEPEGIPTQPSWPEIIGPFYKIDGKENVLWFCRESWQEDKIPFLFGRKQIGKTGILTPYLKSALGENVAVFETGSFELAKLDKLPHNIIILATVHGIESEHYIRQCDTQIENMCSRNLFKPEMFEKRRIELRFENDDVDSIVYQLTGLDTRRRGIKYLSERKKVIKAFSNFRPVSFGIMVLKELLGDKYPKNVV